LVLVRPVRRQQATFDVEDMVSYVEEGYRAATRALDRWVTTFGVDSNAGGEGMLGKGQEE
jgi:hypothetical protein